MKSTLSIAALALLLASCAHNPPPPAHTYTCTGGFTKVTAHYPDTDTARLTLLGEDGTTNHTLHITRSASGARYTTTSSLPAKPGDLVWWNKGLDATLYIATPTDTNTGMTEEKQIAVCTTPTS